jgi:hypothetical protein
VFRRQGAIELDHPRERRQPKTRAHGIRFDNVEAERPGSPAGRTNQGGLTVNETKEKPASLPGQVQPVVSVELLYRRRERHEHVVKRSLRVPAWVVGYGDCSDCGCRLCDVPEVLALEVKNAQNPISICMTCAERQGIANKKMRGGDSRPLD